MKDLMLAVEQAENAWHEAEQLQEAILELSPHELATEILVWRLRESAIHSEILWREIEQRADFIARFGNNRDLARDELLFSGS
ncbi:MAG: hypothetical protein II968_00910 [Selenomonadaceae bacterium]|nr:hypothetical protein [Selenomonadaceae bacterium]